MVDGQHESEAEETRPSVDEAMSDASGDMAKTPSEDDATSDAVTGAADAGTTGAGSGDDAMSDVTADTAKTPDAEDDAL